MMAKRLMKWVIVLFLLSVLPMMTVVLAQDQEPMAPQAPSTWNVYESEPNDTLATADPISVNDVMGGVAECRDGSAECYWDYYRFQMTGDGYVLITAQGSMLGPEVFLADATGTFLVEQSHAFPLFYNLEAGIYYIAVHGWDNVGGVKGPYELRLARPLLVSAAAANLGTGTVAGIQFRSEDVLAHADMNNGEEWWELLFDGSDMSLKSLTNLATDGEDRILLSISGNQTLPGIGSVSPWDIIVFEPDQGTYDYGELTGGTFRMGLPGKSHQLTTAAEKLDAIDGWVNGYNRCYGFPVSTSGVAIVTGWLGTMKQDDEDIFCKVYNNGWQPYDWFFDIKGKNNAPASEPAAVRVSGMPGEDVTALAYDDDTDKMYLTIQGSGNILGHAVNQKDIFALNYPSYSWGGLVWHGPDHGWNYNIDAFEYNPN